MLLALPAASDLRQTLLQMSLLHVRPDAHAPSVSLVWNTIPCGRLLCQYFDRSFLNFYVFVYFSRRRLADLDILWKHRVRWNLPGESGGIRKKALQTAEEPLPLANQRIPADGTPQRRNMLRSNFPC